MADLSVADGQASVTPLATAIALVALGGFLARRYGRLDRTRGSLLSGVCSVAIVAYGLGAVVVATQSGAQIGWGPPIAVFAALSAGVAALVDGLAIPADQVAEMVQLTVAGSAVGVLGLLSIDLWNILLSQSLQATFGTGLSQLQEVFLGAIALGLGTVTVALAYITFNDLGRSFVDVRWPDTRDVVYGVGGFVGLLLVLIAGLQLIDLFGLSSAEHSTVEQAREGDPRILLLLIPASFLIVGPGEELLFRNVVQKSLYGAFSRAGAVVVSSVVFAVVHFPAYATSGLLSILGSLLLVFMLSLVLGVTYARTENVVVPALIHGGYNALQFAALYVAITRDVSLGLL